MKTFLPKTSAPPSAEAIPQAIGGRDCGQGFFFSSRDIHYPPRKYLVFSVPKDPEPVIAKLILPFIFPSILLNRILIVAKYPPDF